MKKNRHRHNKKRNTAFLYETLVREMTKNIISKNTQRKGKIVSILKKYFKKNTNLNKELNIFKALYETNNVDKEMAQSIILEAKTQYEKTINKEELFGEQTRLINDINKNLGQEVFSNFVPNYKSLATIYQMFANNNIKKKIIMEQNLLRTMSDSEDISETLKPVDNLVFKTFVEKYNETYNSSLLKEQKNLLNEYIFSFSNNGLSLKTYLNEEVGRLKEKLKESLKMEEITSDKEMKDKIEEVMNLLESFANQEIDNKMIKKVLKIQKLISETEQNGN